MIRRQRGQRDRRAQQRLKQLAAPHERRRLRVDHVQFLIRHDAPQSKRQSIIC
jgi:hypothetical protein